MGVPMQSKAAPTAVEAASVSIANAQCNRRKRVGILALQGAFEEHHDSFLRLPKELVEQVEIVQVRTCQELDSCDALVIPGGESTTMKIIANMDDFMNRLRLFIRGDKNGEGRPVWGTCAGLILLSDDVVNALVLKEDGASAGEPEKKRCKYGEQMGGLDLKTCRNYFGSQRRSFETLVEADKDCNAMAKATFTNYPAVFIRAPGILSVGEGVSVLARARCYAAADTEAILEGKKPIGEDSVIVAAESERFLATCFHPELTTDDRIHQYFIERFVIGTGIVKA